MKKLLLVLTFLFVAIPLYAENILVIGDSIASGQCGYCGSQDAYPAKDCSTCPCGNTQSQIGYWLVYYLGGGQTFYDAGKAGDTCAGVDSRLSAMITAHHPTRIYVQMGTNHIMTHTFS